MTQTLSVEEKGTLAAGQMAAPLVAITRVDACKHFGKAHRIGACTKCSNLYVWPRHARIELGREVTPCCGQPLRLTTWGNRSAVVLCQGLDGAAVDQAYQWVQP